MGQHSSTTLALGSACILALTATLAACGGQKTPAPTSNQAAATSAPANAGAADQVTTANLAAASPIPIAAQSADTSPPAFAQCKSCHSPEPGKNDIGPSLAGVYGTKAAEVAGYDFSPAMKKSGLTWDEATLDHYLTAPQQVVPGTKMTFPGLKDAAKRATVIAYLQSIK